MIIPLRMAANEVNETYLIINPIALSLSALPFSIVCSKSTGSMALFMEVHSPTTATNYELNWWTLIIMKSSYESFFVMVLYIVQCLCVLMDCCDPAVTGLWRLFCKQFALISALDCVWLSLEIGSLDKSAMFPILRCRFGWFIGWQEKLLGRHGISDPLTTNLSPAGAARVRWGRLGTAGGGAQWLVIVGNALCESNIPCHGKLRNPHQNGGFMEIIYKKCCNGKYPRHPTSRIWNSNLLGFSAAEPPGVHALEPAASQVVWREDGSHRLD